MLPEELAIRNDKAYIFNYRLMGNIFSSIFPGTYKHQRIHLLEAMVVGIARDARKEFKYIIRGDSVLIIIFLPLSGCHIDGRLINPFYIVSTGPLICGIFEWSTMPQDVFYERVLISRSHNIIR